MYSLQRITPGEHDRHVSASQLQTFSRCPRSWHIKYVQGIPEREVSTALMLGAAFGMTLEAVYRRQMVDGLSRADMAEYVSQPDLLDDLAGDACERKLEEMQSRDKFARWDEPDHYKNGKEKTAPITGMHRLKGWVRFYVRRWFDPNDGAMQPEQVLSVEERHDVAIITPDGEVLPRHVTGHTDLIGVYGGERCVAEFKTSKNPWMDRRASREIQGAIYAGATGLPVRHLILQKRLGSPGSHPLAPSSRGADPGVQHELTDWQPEDIQFVLRRIAASIWIMENEPGLAMDLNFQGGFSDPCRFCDHFKHCMDMAGRVLG